MQAQHAVQALRSHCSMMTSGTFEPDKHAFYRWIHAGHAVCKGLKICCCLQLSLCGQDPETALNSALASVNFFLQQQQLYFEFREAQLQKKIDKVQEACKKKLQEVHTGYTAV